MRITELFTAQSIALDEALTDQEQIISRLVELQATHGNITDKEAYKKALYAREAEGSTYVDNGITVPHAKTGVVTHFPTLIGAVMLVIAGLLLIIAGIILDVMAKNDRKTFVIDTNKIAYNKRH